MPALILDTLRVKLITVLHLSPNLFFKSRIFGTSDCRIHANLSVNIYVHCRGQCRGCRRGSMAVHVQYSVL